MNAVTSWMHENTLVLLLAVGTIFNIVWLTIQRNRVHIKTVGTIIISILHTLIGVGCVMVFALAEKGFDKSALGNMSLFGGVFFMPLFYFIFAKLTKHLKLKKQYANQIMTKYGPRAEKVARAAQKEYIKKMRKEKDN